ncbi:MAG: hypothetical protein WC322_06885, partial [Candidatus Paceibacterota bacterium]
MAVGDGVPHARPVKREYSPKPLAILAFVGPRLDKWRLQDEEIFSKRPLVVGSIVPGLHRNCARKLSGSFIPHSNGPLLA